MVHSGFLARDGCTPDLIFPCSFLLVFIIVSYILEHINKVFVAKYGTDPKPQQRVVSNLEGDGQVDLFSYFPDVLCSQITREADLRMFYGRKRHLIEVHCSIICDSIKHLSVQTSQLKMLKFRD